MKKKTAQTHGGQKWVRPTRISIAHIKSNNKSTFKCFIKKQEETLVLIVSGKGGLLTADPTRAKVTVLFFLLLAFTKEVSWEQMANNHLNGCWGRRWRQLHGGISQCCPLCREALLQAGGRSSKEPTTKLSLSQDLCRRHHHPSVPLWLLHPKWLVNAALQARTSSAFSPNLGRRNDPTSEENFHELAGEKQKKKKRKKRLN